MLRHTHTHLHTPCPPPPPPPAPSCPCPQVYEVTFDRMGAFTGLRKAMDLKGHRSRVVSLDFSPDLKRAVTASADGEPLSLCPASHAVAEPGDRRHHGPPFFAGLPNCLLCGPDGAHLTAWVVGRGLDAVCGGSLPELVRAAPERPRAPPTT